MIASAIDRLALFFGSEQTRQGVLARAALGKPGAQDARLVRSLVSTLGAEDRGDGSIGGAAVPTIWRAHELIDLGERPDGGVTARILGWVVGTQGRPGAFGEGCDRERHAQRVCEHYLGGFFAPAPPEQRLAPITMPNGKVFRAEPAARFAISCLALRAVLRAGLGAQPLVRRHVNGLAGLAELWTGWTGYYAPDLIVAGLHALAVAGPAHREGVDRVVGVVAAHQAGDGTWPNADLFHILEA
ncbi:MAG: hypothetical protein ACREMG_06335, partial [Gemmatimonadales bacterium]